MPYSSIIIEDDETASESLKLLIKKNAKEFLVEAQCETVADAVKAIDAINPDLIFLDIDLPDGKGFDVIEKTKRRNYKIIFTTSFDKFAVQAFKVSALHYLLKPIDKNALSEAIQRFKESKEHDITEAKIELFKASLNDSPKKIILPGQTHSIMLNLNDIIRIEGDGPYSHVFTNDKKEYIISKNIGELDRTLKDLHFVRTHNSHIINMNYVVSYNIEKVDLINEKTSPPISRTFRENFLKKLESDSIRV